MAKLCTALPPYTVKGLAAALAAAGSIMALVMLQPDLGSTLVYAVMLAAVLIAAGTPVKVLAGMAAAGLAMLPLGWMVLKPYQRMRLLVFIDPSIDPQGAGYNVIQSRIAVGSGGLFGKGFMHGTQGKLHFLPEPHTDFIFSVFSEEFGFAGCVVVLFLFGVLLLRVLAVSQYTKDVRAKLMCVAIAAWLWFQIFESVAMSMGLCARNGAASAALQLRRQLAARDMHRARPRAEREHRGAARTLLRRNKRFLALGGNFICRE